jgi:hypothetical protein
MRHHPLLLTEKDRIGMPTFRFKDIERPVPAGFPNGFRLIEVREKSLYSMPRFSPVAIWRNGTPRES